jgi:hypothetical protein
MAADIYTKIKLSWAEITFFLILSWFVVYEILAEWTLSKKIVMAIPDFINGSFGISGNFAGTIKAISLFILLPLIYYFLLVLMKRYFTRETWKSAFTQLVLAILPVTASMHLLKALFKTTSRIPYWNYAISDPMGVRSADLIMNNPNLLSNDFLVTVISPAISFFAIILPMIGLVVSFYVIKKQEHTNKLSKAISILAVLIYSGIFLTTLIIWRII